MRNLMVVASLLAGCSNVSGEDSAGGSSGGGSTTAGTDAPATSGGSTSGGPTTNSPTGDGPTSDSATTEASTTAQTSPTTTQGDTGDTGDSSGSATSGETSGSTGTTGTGDDSGEPAGGCGKIQELKGANELKIMAAGIERDYILALPADYDPDKAYPLVFAWHGRGGDGALARLYFKIEEASMGEAIFIYPDGLPLADMQNQTGWDLDPNNEDFALFDALLADTQSRLCIDPARIFSAGHSFGGYMSNQIGCFRGDVVRAIGLVAGGGPFGACNGTVSAWLAHGSLDKVVPFTEGEKSRDHWTTADGCDAKADPVDPAPCTAFTGCDDGRAVTWCPHAEPAFDGHGWPNWAAEGIWGFFASF